MEKIVKQGPAAVRQNLLLKEVLVGQLRERKSQMKDEKSKSLYAQCVSGEIVKKYKIKKQLTRIVNTYLQRKHSVHNDLIFRNSTKEKQVVRETMIKNVEDFLSNDENSANAPSAKDHVTEKEGQKKEVQKKESVLKISQGVIKISRASFYRFFLDSEEVCFSTRYLFVQSSRQLRNAVLQIFAIKDYNHHQQGRNVLSSITCLISNRDCSYRICKNCKHLSLATTETNNEQTFYFQWVPENETRIGANDQNLTVMVTKKKKIECTVSEMVAVFNSQLPSYLKHVSDTVHQYKHLEQFNRSI